MAEHCAVLKTIEAAAQAEVDVITNYFPADDLPAVIALARGVLTRALDAAVTAAAERAGVGRHLQLVRPAR